MSKTEGSDEFKIRYHHSGINAGKTFKAAVEALAAAINDNKNKIVIEFVDAAEILKLQEELAEARAVIEFYGDKNNWLRDEDGWRHDMIWKDLDDETLTKWEGRFSGKRAREFLTKYPKEILEGEK